MSRLYMSTIMEMDDKGSLVFNVIRHDALPLSAVFQSAVADR